MTAPIERYVKGLEQKAQLRLEEAKRQLRFLIEDAQSALRDLDNDPPWGPDDVIGEWTDSDGALLSYEHFREAERALAAYWQVAGIASDVREIVGTDLEAEDETLIDVDQGDAIWQARQRISRDVPDLDPWVLSEEAVKREIDRLYPGGWERFERVTETNA